MDKITRLLKINKNFSGLTVIPSAIFIALYFALLLFSLKHPFLILLTVLLMSPSCWLFVRLLFTYKTKLQNKIKILLTRLIRQELQKEFEANNFNCPFDVKPRVIFDEYCSFDVLYSSISSAMLHHKYAKKVKDTINAKLPSWYEIRFISAEIKDTQPDVVV